MTFLVHDQHLPSRSDPQNVVEFARALYGDNSFLGALYNALTEDGILITQVGNAPERDDPPEQMTADKNRIIYAKSLTRQGFKSIADYSEDHTGFEEPWYFYAAFKDLSTRSYWMASEATINLKIRKRAIRTIDGTSPFDYFDGAMMKKYQLPSQASVDLFCRRQPTPVGCEVSSHGFNPYILNYPEDFFNVSRSLAGEYAGRGVFTKSMIPKGSYLMLESMVYPVTIEAPSTSLIERMSNNLFADDVLTGFLYGYGYSSLGFGVANKIEVDSGIMTFVNHGCHGASNLGMFPNMTESTVHPFLVPKELTFYRSEGEDYVFNPAIARDTFSRSEVQNRWGDIELGEELLENYYEQFSGSKDWKELVELLHGFCSGGLGEVEQYILDRNVGGDNDDEEHYLDQQNCARSAVSGSSAELMHLVDVSMMP